MSIDTWYEHIRPVDLSYAHLMPRRENVEDGEIRIEVTVLDEY